MKIHTYLGVRIRISRICRNDNFNCSGFNGNHSHWDTTQPTRNISKKCDNKTEHCSIISHAMGERRFVTSQKRLRRRLVLTWLFHTQQSLPNRPRFPQMNHGQRSRSAKRLYCLQNREVQNVNNSSRKVPWSHPGVLFLLTSTRAENLSRR